MLMAHVPSLGGGENHQHAGPKLSGYPTSTATKATAIQRAAGGVCAGSSAAPLRGPDAPVVPMIDPVRWRTEVPPTTSSVGYPQNWHNVFDER